MTYRSLEDWYRRFSTMYGNSEPIRPMSELDAAIRAAGLRYDQVTVDWLRSLDESWVYQQADTPFDDERSNREYRRLVHGLGQRSL